jgi:hypothetical protein
MLLFSNGNFAIGHYNFAVGKFNSLFLVYFLKNGVVFPFLPFGFSDFELLFDLGLDADLEEEYLVIEHGL